MDLDVLDTEEKLSSQNQPSTSRGSGENEVPWKRRKFSEDDWDRVSDTDSTSSNDSANSNATVASGIEIHIKRLSRKRKASTTHSDDSSSCSKRRKYFVDNLEMPSDGLKLNQHGTYFQLNLLKLVLWRACIHNYAEFRLATELPEAEKFDDVSFQYREKSNEGWKCRLYQAKHKEGGRTSIIDKANLLAVDDDEDFSIQKYFRSLMRIERRCKEESLYSTFSGAKVEDIVIITNADFTKELKGFFEIDTKHGIKNDALLGFDDMPLAQKYKFPYLAKSAMARELIPILDSTSDFNKLVQLLAPYIVNGFQLDKTLPVVKEYIFALKRHVFEHGKLDKNDEFCLKFSSNFLKTGQQSTETLKFRNALLKEIAFLKSPPQFRMAKNFGIDQFPDNQTKLKELGKKFATFVEKKEELKIADFTDSHTVLAKEVINCSTRKLRSAFINPDNVRIRTFRDLLKGEIGSLRNVKRVTNKDLESLQVICSQDFGQAGLPNDLDKLDRIADSLAAAFKQKKALDPCLAPELNFYHCALSKEVVDISTGYLHDAFLKGEGDGNSNKANKLPANTKVFRRLLIDKIISDDKLFEMRAYFEKIRVPISKGLAEDFQADMDPKIEGPKTFALQMHQILTSQATTKNCFVLSKNCVFGSQTDLRVFEANICALAEGNVLITRFSKIRFSTHFIESAKLLGNLDIFRNELVVLLGHDNFKLISECSFDVHVAGFRPHREESIFQTLPQPCSDTDFKDFFEKLRFIVKYPNRLEIDHLLENEMRDQLRNLNSKAYKALFQENLYRWMTDRIGTFYTAEKARQLFDEIDRDVLCWPMHGVNRSYFSSVPMRYVFNTQADLISSFLKNNDVKVLNLIFEKRLLGRMRIVQTFLNLQKADPVETRVYTRTFGYIFFMLKQLENPDFYKEIASNFDSERQWNLVVIEANIQKKVRKLYKRLKTSIKLENPSRKIILISEPQDRISNTLEEDPVLQKLSRKEIIRTSYHDLVAESQDMISEKGKLWLQRSELNVNQIIDDSLKGFIDASTLVKFIVGDRVKIGNKLEFPEGYDPSHYIDRFLNFYVEIKSDVRNKCADVLIISDFEDDFIEACRRYDEKEKRSIHWLRSVSGKLIWQKTCGTISALVRYRDEQRIGVNIVGRNLIPINKSPDSTNTQSEIEVISSNEKLLIISNVAGMGKTTVLSSISKRFRINDRKLWVVRIDLNDYSSFFDQELSYRIAKKPRLKCKDRDSAIKFFLDLLQSNGKSELKTDLEVNLLETVLKQPSKLKFIFLFDAFDEISPGYKDIVLDLLLGLQLSHVQKLIVTTRPSMQQHLERGLGMFACTLRQFSKDEQITFLRKFWAKRMKSLKVDQLVESSVLSERLSIYANTIIQKQSDTISDKHLEFTGIPLQLRFLAEIFEENEEECDWQGCKEFIGSTNAIPKLPERLNVFDLYRKFIEKKYFIYRKDKMRQDMTNEATKIESLDSFKTFMKQHQKLALYATFDKEDLEVLLSACGDFDEEMEEIVTYMDRIESGREMRGIVNQIVNGRPHFIHRTISEYFVADYLGTTFVRKVQHRSLHELLLTKILPSVIEFRPIRAFFEAWLSSEKHRISSSTKKIFAASIVDVWLKNEKKANFLHVACEEGFTETVSFICECLRDNVELLREMVNSASGERTMLYQASLANNLDIIKILVKCGADVNTRVYGHTVFQSAVGQGRFQICKWLATPKEEGGPDADIDTKAELGRTTFDSAVHRGDLDFCKWLIERGLKFNSNDNVGRTPLHGAVLSGHLHIAQWLISIGADKTECDKRGRNILHYACMTGQLNIVKWLVTPIDESGCGMDIHHKDNAGMSVLHTASTASNLDLLEWFLDQGFEINSTDNAGRTPLHLAAHLGHLRVVQWLVKKGADPKAVTHTGLTVLHLAANANKPATCEWLLEQGLDPYTANHNNIFPIQMAAVKGHLEIVQKLLFGKNPTYASHQNGDTLLHFAASSGKIPICEWLLQHEGIKKAGLHINSSGRDGGKMIQIATQTNLKLLKWLISNGADINCRDNNGYTVLHYAAGYGKLEICKWLVKSKEEGGAGIDVTVKAHGDSTETSHLEGNNSNQTALDIAQEKGHRPIVTFLKDYINKKFNCSSEKMQT
ncbi:unnamed protein product [Hermetia illucens]|uniref:Uncharacterized protein n=1 Tax=Hermetia illucens TaxID=343691 RepID=A0A7R8YV07_HERIL|nr:unnamed protein product [Hermetia illucens]